MLIKSVTFHFFQALYLQNNKLKQLPGNIGSLKNLQTLNISGNNLKDLPSTISGLASLKTLDISNNQKLVKLPKELGHLHSLGKQINSNHATFINIFPPSETLVLDTDGVTYPSKDITEAGTEAIMKFFCSGKTHPFIRPIIVCQREISSFSPVLSL